jgi:putative FmdB family regulatory protein
MAVYTFKCKDCKDLIEVEQSIYGEVPSHAHCEKCGGKAKRTWNSPSINLVGRGFYRNGG